MFKDFEAEPREESWDEIRTSVQLPQLFQDFEAEPQNDTWTKIRAALDLPQHMEAYEPEPQEDTWEKIRAGIDLPQIMATYEPDPQEESWKKIRAGVDLAQKFENYEAEPQAISWLKIQEAIQPKKRRRGIIIPLFYRVGIAAGLVLLLGSLWWLLNSKDSTGMTATNTGNKKPASGTQTNTHKSRASEITGKTQTGSKSPDVNALPSHTERTASALPTQTERTSSASERIANAPKRGTNDLQKGYDKANSNKNNEALLANNKVSEKNNPGASVTPVNEEKKPEKQENTLADNNTESSDNIKLEQLSAKGFQQKPIRKPFSAIAFNAEKPYQEREQRVYRKTILTASLMPLQTYQAFTILPQTTTYIQQVGRLDAIDNQRLGIQLRAGAMKPLSDRFSMGVSAAYTGVQQWANYEINNGDYEVQTADNGSYTLVGIGEQVAQKQFLQTIGLKLDNAYLVSKKKTSIYAIGGAEAVHVLNNKDFGYYVNASVGFSYPIKGGKSLWIEPTFRYSLSQSFDANNYLKIRPYNIGLNLRINFI